MYLGLESWTTMRMQFAWILAATIIAATAGTVAAQQTEKPQQKRDATSPPEAPARWKWWLNAALRDASRAAATGSASS